MDVPRNATTDKTIFRELLEITMLKGVFCIVVSLLKGQWGEMLFCNIPS
jgi:hypothetical protein